MPAPDVASQLARTCPALAADWAETGADLELPYVALGHLAGRLVAVDQARPDTDFGPLFDEVEHLLVGGDSAMRNLVAAGFLEALQNQGRGASAKWEPLLGPVSRAAWTALTNLWSGRISPKEFNRLIDG
jgi:hypothetical protein